MLSIILRELSKSTLRFFPKSIQVVDSNGLVLLLSELLFGVNLCSLFGVTLEHAGAGGVVGRDSGYCVITLPGRLNHNLST
jgi:hypothetical protein